MRNGTAWLCLAMMVGGCELGVGSAVLDGDGNARDGVELLGDDGSGGGQDEGSGGEDDGDGDGGDEGEGEGGEESA